MSRSRVGDLLVERKTAELLTTELLKSLKRWGLDDPGIFKEIAKQMHLRPEEVATGEKAFRDAHISSLEEYPEPTPEKLSEALIAIRTRGPSLRKVLLELAKQLPVERGGRPRLLKRNDERQVNAMISELLSRGVEKPDAIKRAAVKFGVRVWTARRAWKRYQEQINVNPHKARKHGR